MEYPIRTCLNEIIGSLKNVLASKNIDIDISLETPPENLGDFAFPCFALAPLLKKSPQTIASDLAQELKPSTWIAHIEAKNGYINFFINPAPLIQKTLALIQQKKERYGALSKKQKKIIIEHTSANPNGPLHVGRARNPIIGDTLVRLYRKAGYQVESQFYLDDMGKQVAILTWGLKHIDPKDISFPSNKKLDHQYVGFYQKATSMMNEDETVAKEIQTLIQLGEEGDEKTLSLMKSAYLPVLQGIKESLHKINVTIDRYVAESTFVRDKSVETIVKKMKTTAYCAEENKALYLDLEPFGVQGRNTKFFLTRQDGTTLYATRDIAYHLWKAQKADQLINILGEDHRLEARQVAIALELLKAKTIPMVIFYAFVSLPEGKMSTRRGRVVYLDDLLDEAVNLAYQEVKKRRASELSDKTMKKIAEIVGIGALRYNIIKVQPEKDIVFKWEDALNFEGNAAPFIQYAHARACSILRKASGKQTKPDTTTLTHETELRLLKNLAKFPFKIEDACTGCKPHTMTTYLYETASSFNQFYRDCPVLSEPNNSVRNARLALVHATQIVLRYGLDLLGITAPEEM